MLNWFLRESFCFVRETCKHVKTQSVIQTLAKESPHQLNRLNIIYMYVVRKSIQSVKLFSIAALQVTDKTKHLKNSFIDQFTQRLSQNASN